MLRKLISTILILASISLLFLAAHSVIGQGTESQVPIDKLKQQAIDYLKQNNLSDENSIIKRIFSDYKEDAKQPLVIYELAEFCRNNSKFTQALELYKFITTNYKTSSQALNCQRGIVVCSIALKRLDEAKKELQVLKSDYASEPNLPSALFAVADGYYWNNFLSDSNNLYREILLNYPNSNAAMQSVMGLSISSIASKDEISADKYTKQLISDYEGNRRLPQYLLFIANRWSYDKKYAKADEIYGFIINNFGETRTAVNAKYESDKMKVYILLDSKDEPNALKKIETFYQQYKDRSDLAAVLYDFAARYDWINSGKVTDLSKEIYSRVSVNFPNTVQSKDSSLIQRKAQILSSIESGNDINIISDVDKFIADFRGSQLLPEAVYRIGEIYWNSALEAEKEQNDIEALPDFKKASQIWEKIESLLPFSAPDVLEYTYYGLSNCYHRLGDYKKASEYYNKILNLNPQYIKGFDRREFICGDSFCGAYAVWYTLQFSGFSETIDDIIKEMGIYNKGFSSIYDIIKILKSKGLDCQAVRINFDNVAKLEKPFIQYLAPNNGNSIGHFVLCVPDGKGKAVVLDGTREPKVIDLDSYKEDNILQTRWDGTAIFIEDINPIFKQNIITWNSALLYSNVWLNNTENIDLQFIEERLSSEIQKRFIGGWPSYDCLTNTQKCLTNRICFKNADCTSLTTVCNDYTFAEFCYEVGYSSGCTYDLAHTCSPLVGITGQCGTPGEYCGIFIMFGAPCGATPNAPNGSILQCH